MADQLVIRKSVEKTDLSALRDSYQKMQDLSATDNRSWVFWAGIHGFPRFDCWHHFAEGGQQFAFNLFLPWHRAYLLYWEHVARDQNDGAVPPWWDWTSPTSHETGIPAGFSEEQFNGNPNSLFSGPVPDMPNLPGHRTRRFPGTPSDLPSATDVKSLIDNSSSFEDFSAGVENLHDGIHGWVGGIDPDDPSRGGDMGVVATSAFDPIFWAHHCMIDRIWYLWQLRWGVTNIPPDYLDQPLAPFRFTVRQVLDIHALGYEYATGSGEAAGPAADGGAQ